MRVYCLEVVGLQTLQAQRFPFQDLIMALKLYKSSEVFIWYGKAFINIVNKHAPLKKKFIRGNQAPFMTRNLRKEIYTRSRFRNKFCKIPPTENEKPYKKQRNVLPLQGSV